MGAGASAATADGPSVEEVSTWSKEDVGEQVAAIGEAFEQYKDIAVKEGIDGQMLLDLDDEDLEEYVTKKVHRKNIRKKIDALKAGAASTPSVTAVDQAQPAAAGASAAAGAQSADGSELKLFMSYPRGEETTPFARKLKVFLEARGFSVWMDEEGIAGGVDFMRAIGGAIKASRGLVAIINDKFCSSTYCNNELAMA